jgi:hypothetical protein
MNIQIGNIVRVRNTIGKVIKITPKNDINKWKHDEIVISISNKKPKIVKPTQIEIIK